MKILALHSTAELYGADRIFALCVGFLKDAGNEVDVVLGENGRLSEFIKNKINLCPRVEKLPVAVRSKLSLRFFINFIWRLILLSLRVIALRKKYDIVYINTLSLAFCAPIFRLFGGSKIVIHSHEIISGKFLTNFIIRIAVYSSHQVVCVSYAVREDMLTVVNARNSDKLVIVYNGIRDEFQADIVAGLRPSLGDKEIVMLLLGRVMPEKGHYFLLRALSALPVEISEKILVKVVGSPPPARMHLADEFRYMADSLSLGNVMFLGEFVDNPYGEISRCDVMLVPSLMRDPFPTTVLEAMMHAKPVIATNHGGAKEIVGAAESGFLIEPENVGAFVEAISNYVHNRNLIYTHGINGRRFYLSELTDSHFKARFIATLSLKE